MSFRSHTIAAITCLAFAAPAWAQDASDLAPPVRLYVGDVPIDVQGAGHSAPFFGDFDGDGVKDLLVGQFDDGKLRIYRNEGEAKAPRFGKSQWFQAGGGDAKVPTG